MRRCCAVALQLLLLTPSVAIAEGEETFPLLLTGDDHRYSPIVRYEPRKMLIEAPLSMRARLEGIGDYPVDLQRAGQRTTLHTGAFGNVQARVALKINTRRALIPFNLGAEYEHDLVTGPMGGKPEIEGDGLPNSEGLEHQLRKAYGRVSLGYYLHLMGGLMTSQWGMGLLSNDGAHTWEPGSAAFTDPRGGDRVVRVALSTGPLTRLGLFAAVGYDWIYADDVTLEDDDARQLITAFAIGRDRPHTLGVYVVWRTQEAPDGDTTDVTVVDLHGRTSFAPTPRLKLALEIESALVFGESGLGSSPEYPNKDVLQLGVALRASLGYREKVGGVIDFLYASGDENFDDDTQNAFKPDPNYEIGLLLYRHVMAGQTGRAPFNASDPNLVGTPNEDLDRFPTRASASNTIAFFPRVWWRPTVGVELYGGPLFTFTAVALADPLNIRLAGGVPRNSFNASPGRYLGTELDVGARFQALVAGTLLTLGAEGGALFPGSAFEGEDGQGMDAVLGGRVMVGYQF